MPREDHYHKIYRDMKKNIWTICKVLFIALSILTFTSIVIPTEQANPTFLGLPRTLWIGLLISLSFILLTIIGSIFINTSKTEK